MGSSFKLNNGQDQEFSIVHNDNAGAITVASDKLVVKDSAGNVGIGTGSNINAKLNAQGSIRQYNPGATDNSVINQANGGKNWYVGLRGDSSNIWAIADETTFKLTVDTNGNILARSGTGGLGYGTGAGISVTQASTSGKATPVAFNKPTAVITMDSAALAAGVSIGFYINNTLIINTDNILVQGVFTGAVNPENYQISCSISQHGAAKIVVKNISGSTLSEALKLQFSIVRGATA